MKRLMIVLAAIFMIASLSAFDKGTLNIGGSVSFDTFKHHPDMERKNTIVFSPQLGYFVMEDLSADLLLNFSKVSHGGLESEEVDYGIGFRYFINQIYAGAGYMEKWTGINNYDLISSHINAKVGYLLPVSDYIFLNLSADYLKGIGKYRGDSSGNNKQEEFKFKLGIDVYLYK